MRPTPAAPQVPDAQDDHDAEALRADLEAVQRASAAGVDRANNRLRHLQEAYTERLATQSESTKALSETVTSIVGAVKEIAGAYREMLQTVGSVGALTRELDNSFHLQVETQKTMADQAIEAGQASEEEVRQAQALRGNLGQLEAIREFMAGAIETIDEVTNRLNILSINGRIEAAHAGAAGRGFAVVAGEMLKLQQESQKIIGSQRGQLDQFVPLMAAMQQKSDRVEDQARHQQDSIRKVAGGSQTLQNQTRSNQDRMAGLTAAVEEMAACIEEGERTCQSVDREAAKVERIFNEEVYVFQKVNALDKILFNLGRQARSLAEAAHLVVNEYQRISVLNGSNYVWRGEVWLVTDRRRLPPALADQYQALGDRVFVCIGQTDNNPGFPRPVDPAEGILEVRPLADLDAPASRLQGLSDLLAQARIDRRDLADPSRIQDPYEHAAMAVTEAFEGPYARVLADDIARHGLVCHFGFGGVLDSGDVVICHLLSTYQRHRSDAEKFAMVGTSFILAVQDHAEAGRYWRNSSQ